MFQYQCLSCSYFTNFKRDYNRHINTLKHKKKTENDKNSLCGQNLLQNAQKQTFVAPKSPLLHKNEQPLAPKCAKKGIRNLTDFDKNAHKKSKEFLCSICGRGYTRKNNYKRHIEQNRCKPVDTKKKLKRTKKESLVDQINELSKKLAVQDKIMESQEEHFRGILKEKERCIEILREQNQHITTSHFQIIQNNIIDMNAIKFLNSYCNNNPTLDEITTKIKEGTISEKDSKLIRDAIQTGNLKIVGNVINRIMKTTNQELIFEKGALSGFCDNVIFCNDGSGRKYIAKGEPGWTYFSNDDPLDKTIIEIVDKTDKQNKNKIKEDVMYLPVKERTSVAKFVKKQNDWNHSKDIVMKNILGSNNVHVIEQPPNSPLLANISHISCVNSVFNTGDDLNTNLEEFSDLE